MRRSASNSGSVREVASADLDCTRDRLLDVAGEEFAASGYEKATIRDIVARAKANIAAVNYHFGGKQQLYRAAMQHGIDVSSKLYPLDEALVDARTPKHRLHAFVRMFLRRILAGGKPAWHGRLMAREMAEPTGALEELARNTMRPFIDTLQEIVREIVGDHLSQLQLERCVMSVIAQCVFFNHARPVLEVMYPDHMREPMDVDGIAEHVAQFSYAGLKALASEKTKHA
ncbi:MAG: CerR family C-terminal domain-containing protein [Tepidisphaeraceae bacterium]